MTTFIGNAFSLSMVPDGATIRTRTVNLPSIAHKLNNPVSVVGHADTASVFEKILGIKIIHNRVNLHIGPKDTLYVGQYTGPRLPEGATCLPQGADIKWICINIDAPSEPLERTWTEDGTSIYGAIDRAAKEVAAVVHGSVSLMQDGWGNPHWHINAPGFYGDMYDD